MNIHLHEEFGRLPTVAEPYTSTADEIAVRRKWQHVDATLLEKRVGKVGRRGGEAGLGQPVCDGPINQSLRKRKKINK